MQKRYKSSLRYLIIAEWSVLYVCVKVPSGRLT